MSDPVLGVRYRSALLQWWAQEKGGFDVKEISVIYIMLPFQYFVLVIRFHATVSFVKIYR